MKKRIRRIEVWRECSLDEPTLADCNNGVVIFYNADKDAELSMCPICCDKMMHAGYYYWMKPRDYEDSLYIIKPFKSKKMRDIINRLTRVINYIIA